MFKKILFATDLSKASDNVLNYGNGLKNLGAEEVILFYALGQKILKNCISRRLNESDSKK